VKNLAALMTSNNGHYCTPPSIVGRVHRMLREKHIRECQIAGVKPLPKGKVVPFTDPFTNDASLVQATWTCDITKGQDGNAFDWGARKRDHADKAFVYENPEYGNALEQAMATTHRFGRELETCEIVALLPNRPDTQWCQRHVKGSADAWIDVEGRLTFWRAIPIADPRPPKEQRPTFDKAGKETTPMFLRRWYPDASDTNLPTFKSGDNEEKCRLLAPGIAMAPELGANGKPQSAPFPSLMPYWGEDVVLFAKCFGSLGTLTIARGSRIPPLDESLIAACPPEVQAWITLAKDRKSGVYQRVGT
jgi:hypothetical protein